MSTSTIHDLVSKGILTEKDLLAGDRLQAINEVHPESLLTPLGAAVLKGDVSTTRLLLRYGADVNKPSGKPSKTRTPLWIAVSKMPMEEKIGHFVNILLDAGADPNLPSADDNNSAPLLNAVKRNCDPEVIMKLVESKASLTAKDGSGRSAESLAKKKGLKIQSALSANSWRMDRLKAVGMVTGLVLFVAAWSNTTPSQRRRIAAGAALLLLGGVAAISAGQRTAQPTGTTQRVTEDTTKVDIGNPADDTNQPADGSPKPPVSGSVIKEPKQSSSTTEAVIDNPAHDQPTADNTNQRADIDGSPKLPIGDSVIKELEQSSDTTQSGTSNATEAAISNPTQSATDNTNQSADDSSKSSVGATTQTAAGNNAEPAINNDAQAIPNETTQPTASVIQTTNNNAAQPATGDDDNGNNDTALSGAIFERFNMSGEFGDDMPSELKELMIEKDVEEFKKGINDYITKSNLNKFFPPDNPFLKIVVKKALDLEKDPQNFLDVKDLTKLSLYQTVLYLDDSGSMRKGTRRNDLKELVRRIASIATRLLPDGEGVELRFINASTKPSYSKPSLDMIDNIISDLPMWGWTPIGTNLIGKILLPLVYQRLTTENFTRPMLVSIITDGYPEGPQGRPSREKRDSLKDAILECRRILTQRGYDSNSVLFQISQIGTEEEATEFIDSLRLDQDLDDILYCTTDQLDAKYNELRLNHQRLEQFLFSTLLSPILNADPT